MESVNRDELRKKAQLARPPLELHGERFGNRPNSSGR